MISSVSGNGEKPSILDGLPPLLCLSISENFPQCLRDDYMSPGGHPYRDLDVLEMYSGQEVLTDRCRHVPRYYEHSFLIFVCVSDRIPTEFEFVLFGAKPGWSSCGHLRYRYWRSGTRCVL